MKGKWCLVLGASMLLTQLTFGESADSKLQKAIEMVKEKVDLGEEYTQFDYYAHEKGYSFNWNTENEKWDSISVDCDSEGNIFSYYAYGDDFYSGSVAKIDYNTGKQTAQAFLNSAVPEYANLLTLHDSSVNSTISKGSSYYYEYQLCYEDIPVFGQLVTVCVNKQTGEVENFNGIDYEPGNFVANEGLITMEEAEKKYLEAVGLELFYSFDYEYDRMNDATQINVYPVYEVKGYQDQAIDAKTGKLISSYFSDEDYKNVAVTEAMSGGNMADGAYYEEDKVSLSEAELKAVDEAKGLLSIEQLVSKASKYFPRLKELKVTDSYLYSEEGIYRQTISFEQSEPWVYADLCVNGATGEIFSYTYNCDTEGIEPTHSLSDKEAEELLKQLAPEAFSQTKKQEENQQDFEKAYNDIYESVYYQRFYDGKRVDYDGLSIGYNKALGEITSFYKQWTKAELPKISGELTPAEILSKEGVKLYYWRTGDKDYTLAYSVDNIYKSYDPYTGDVINFNGEDESDGLYTDIAGTTYETEIKMLYYSGIYLEGSQLRPDSSISYEELKQLVDLAMENGNYKVFATTEEEAIVNQTHIKDNSALSRQEGIAYLLARTNYGKLAKVNEIYTYPFEDTTYDKDKVGALAMSYALELLPWKNTKTISPEKALTKGEAFSMIYRYLSAMEQ